MECAFDEEARYIQFACVDLGFVQTDFKANVESFRPQSQDSVMTDSNFRRHRNALSFSRHMADPTPFSLST